MALFEDVSRKLICENLRYIMIKNGIKTQKELAEKIGVTPVMLHHVIVGEQYPSVYPFLAGIQNAFGYKIDDFLFRKLSDLDHDNRFNRDVVKSVLGYSGVYQTYYYTERGDKLKSGILLIGNIDGKTHTAPTILVNKLNPEYADVCFGKAKELLKENCYMDAEAYLESFSRSELVYKGEVNFTADHLYYNMKHCSSQNVIQMVFYRRFSMHGTYKGGLGTMSVIEGRKREPSLRYVGVSSRSQDVEKNDMAEYLTIDSQYKIKENYEFEIDVILEKLVKAVLEQTSYSLEDHKHLAELKLNRAMQKIIKNQREKVMVVTVDQDDAWCRMLERHMSKTA